MGTGLELLGVVACGGGGLAISSLPYANVSRNRLCCLLFLPGLYCACAELFRCVKQVCGFELGIGQRGDMLDLLGMKPSMKWKYAGLQSGTHKAVANALFEGWVRAHSSHPHTSTASVGVRRRPTVVGFVSCRMKNQYDLQEPRLKLNKVTGHNILLAVLQALTWMLWYWIVCSGDVRAIVTTCFNLVASFLLFSSVTSVHCVLANPSVAAGTPPGHSVVLDEDNNNMWVVLGNEYDIQTLLQYPIKIQQAKAQTCLQLLAAVIGCCCAATTVLLMPSISPTCQAYLAYQLCVGLVAAVTMMYGGGDSMLSQLAENFFHMENTCKIEFSSRTAAVAAALIATRGTSSNMGVNFVPTTTEPWTNFRRALDLVVQHMQPHWTAAHVEAFLQQQNLVLHTTYATVHELKEAFDAVRCWEANLPTTNKHA